MPRKKADKDDTKTFCVVCGVSKAERPKNWRKDKCNSCYAKLGRQKKRKKLEEETGESFAGDTRVKWSEGTKAFGCKAPKSSICLLAGFSEYEGKSRTEILVEMINDRVESKGYDRAEIQAIGRALIDGDQ